MKTIHSVVSRKRSKHTWKTYCQRSWLDFSMPWLSSPSLGSPLCSCNTFTKGLPLNLKVCLAFLRDVVSFTFALWSNPFHFGCSVLSWKLFRHSLFWVASVYSHDLVRLCVCFTASAECLCGRGLLSVSMQLNTIHGVFSINEDVQPSVQCIP